MQTGILESNHRSSVVEMSNRNNDDSKEMTTNSILLTQQRDPYSSKASTIAVTSFKTPKHTLAAIIRAGMAKATLPWHKTIILSIVAGLYIAVGGLLAIAVSGGVSGPGSASMTGTITTLSNNSSSSSSQQVSLLNPAEPGIQKLLQGAVFPVGLMLVVWAGAELFTGNVMFLSSAWFAGTIKWWQVLKSWLISYFSNFIGAVLFAYFMSYLTQLVHTDPWHAYLMSSTSKKIYGNGWGQILLKGVGCNWLVNLALWNGIVSDDLVGKCIGLFWPVFTFVAIGFEHSIANMFYLTLGLMEGADATFGDLIAYNLIPVTLGNIIGGLIFIGMQYAVYGEFINAVSFEIKQGQKEHKGVNIPIPASIPALFAAASAAGSGSASVTAASAAAPSNAPSLMTITVDKMAQSESRSSPSD